MTPELESAATASLAYAWAWRWLFIVGAGAVPAGLAELKPSWKGTPRLRRFKSFMALVGLVTCILSGPLLLDTVNVETKDARALEQAVCEVTGVPAHRWSSLNCADGSSYSVELAALPEHVDLTKLSGQEVLVDFLPWSKLAVALSIRDEAGASGR